MRFTPGDRLSHYEITAFLDAGGMGDVYRARDPRLARDVAIKVLGGHATLEPEAKARFRREARAVARLSHPNILAVHDVGDDDRTDIDTPFVVTELLVGENLRVRLERGRLSKRTVLDFGCQIAEGLAAAHAQRVIHRDLKPENIFVTQEGRVKILDFGLAALQPAITDASDVLPKQVAATRPGQILGTAAYMAPEQAASEPTDARSDVFSLGCVLYEMATGMPAFARRSFAETLVAVLREDPPSLPADVPADLAEVILRCLAKNPEQRFQSAQDVAIFLDVLGRRSTGAMHAAPTVVPTRSRVFRPWLSALIAIGAVAFAAGWLLRAPSPPAGPPILSPITYTGHDSAPAVSHDGKRIAFVSDRDGTRRIWLKHVTGGDESPLTQGPDRAPRFAPDDASILFMRSEGETSSLLRIPSLGGTPRRLVRDIIAADPSPEGERLALVRWQDNESDLLDAALLDTVLLVADADGGGETEVARIPDRRAFQPRWSPDGTMIALVDTESAIPSIIIVELETGRVRDLAAHVRPGFLSAPAWTQDSRHLLYAVTESLIPRHGGIARVVRHPLDERGAPTTLLWLPSVIEVVEAVDAETLVLAARTPSMNLVETRGVGAPSHWLTRGSSSDRQPVYSPDGREILFSSNRTGNLDLWSVVAATGAIRRLTGDDGEDWDPAYLPDGRMVWSSNRSGVFEIWLAEQDGSAPRQVTFDGTHAENPTVTPDGKWIIYNSRNPESPGLRQIRPDGRDGSLLVPGNLRLPEVSPDGKHILALTDIRPDSLSMCVMTIAGTRLEPKIFLSARGGRARWLPDGTGIAYTAPTENGTVGIFQRSFPFIVEEPAQPLRVLPGTSIDSFALAPDGRLVYASEQVLQNLVVASGIQM